MKPNMGTLDRSIRIMIAFVIGSLYYTHVITAGTTAIILLIIAGMFILTSFVGFCPLYYPLRLSTRRKKTIKVE